MQHRKEVAEYVPEFNVNPWLRQTTFQNQQIEEFGVSISVLITMNQNACGCGYHMLVNI